MNATISGGIFMNFTEKLEKINEIQKNLEKNNISLEDAMEEFENGIKLIKECKAILDSASQKVNILTEDGEVEFKGRKDD